MARSRRRKRRGGESVSTWLIAAGLVAAAVVSVYVVVTSPDPVQYDAETLCPEDERLITHHEVLLFRAEPAQRRQNTGIHSTPAQYRSRNPEAN